MSAHPPPVPPDNRSPKGQRRAQLDAARAPSPKLHPAKAPDNLAEQGEQGNMKQNTTNQGYQQDR